MVPDRFQWRLLLPSTAREQDPAFRSVLTDVLHTGLRQCGAIGLVASLLYVGLSVFGLGYDLRWTYETVVGGGLEQQIVLAGILVGAALSVIGLVLSQSKCSLQSGRLFGWGAVLMAAAVATFEGAARGTFSTEYVILIYLLVVAIIPFRPLQVVGVGGTVALVMYLLGPSGPAWQGSLTFSPGMAKHLAFLGGGTVLVTGASVALYLRHHSFGSTQASLQKSRDLLRRTQEVAQVGGWEYDPTTDTVQGTEELFSILDLPPDTHFDLETWLQFYREDARDEVRASIERCIDRDEPFDLEVPFTTAADEHRWVRLRGTARRMHGTTTRLTGILQDITEQERMARQLRKRERRLNSITEHVSDGIYRTAPGQGLVYANQAFAQLFGYDRADEVLDLDPCALYANSEQATDLLYGQHDKEQHGQEVAFRRKDGSTFIGLLGGTIVRDDQGEIQYVDGVITDITNLKEREAMLQGERDRFETLFESLLREEDGLEP